MKSFFIIKMSSNTDHEESPAREDQPVQHEEPLTYRKKRELSKIRMAARKKAKLEEKERKKAKGKFQTVTYQGEEMTISDMRKKVGAIGGRVARFFPILVCKLDCLFILFLSKYDNSV